MLCRTPILRPQDVPVPLHPLETSTATVHSNSAELIGVTERIRSLSDEEKVCKRGRPDGHSIDIGGEKWHIRGVRIPRTPRLSRAPTPKRASFSSIPRKFSRSIDKRRFTRDVLRSFFGGDVRSSLNPLKRKDVRDALDRAGVLGMLDATANGPRSQHERKLTEQEAINILKKTRAAIRQNLKESGYGVREEGSFYGRQPRSIYRRAIEEAFGKEGGKSLTEQREEVLALRVRQARRRELVRQQLGLSTLKKLAEEKLSRREALERRLESTKEKPSQPRPAKDEKSSGSGAGGPAGAPAREPRQAGAGSAFAPGVPHIRPPRTGEDEAETPRPEPEDRPQDVVENRKEAPENEPPPSDEPKDEDRIDENLPL